MRLTLHTDYALRVLMHAALQQPGLVTINEVAITYDISKNHLVKIVQKLAQNGFLKTHRGIGGGFTLGLPAGKISLGDVVRLTESDDRVVDCVSESRTCRIFPGCRLKGVLAEAAAAFFAVLDSYSLDDLVRNKFEMRHLLNL